MKKYASLQHAQVCEKHVTRKPRRRGIKQAHRNRLFGLTKEAIFGFVRKESSRLAEKHTLRVRH